jgi:hypothetical protein
MRRSLVLRGASARIFAPSNPHKTAKVEICCRGHDSLIIAGNDAITKLLELHLLELHPQILKLGRW